MRIAAVAVLIVSIFNTRANAQADALVLTGKFGEILVSTTAGRLTNLKLRNPDGSLPDVPLSGNPAQSVVMEDDGARYESQYGAPRSVVIHHDSEGAISKIILKGITLGRSPVLSPVAVGATGSCPDSIAFTPDGNTAYVTNFQAGSVTPFNPKTGSVSAPIKIGGNPTGIIVTPDGNLFVSDAAGGQVIEIASASHTVVSRIKVGINPQFLAETPDGNVLLVPNEGSNTVSVVDTSSSKVVATIPVGASPVTVAVTPNGKRAYVTNSGAANVTPIDLTTLAPLQPITLTSGPYGAAVTPDGSTLTVSLNQTNTLILINTATDQILGNLDLDVHPRKGVAYGVRITPDGSKAYVAEAATNSFSAPYSVVPIDLRTRQTLAPLLQDPANGFVLPGLHPDGVAVSPDGHLLLAANWGGNSLSRFALQQRITYAPVTEDWTLSTSNQTGSLQWMITQSWQGTFKGINQADPIIPFSYGTVSTLWYQPGHLVAPEWNGSPNGKAFGDAPLQTLPDKKTWVIYKLWSPFHFESDLELGISGAYLTHYVSPYGAAAAAGAQLDATAAFTANSGESRRLTLSISPRNKYETGYQLDVRVPDEVLLHSLRDMYESILNGGAIADQKGYWLGNEASGVITAYQALDAGVAIGIGAPSPKPESAHEYSLPSAFRGYLGAVFASVKPSGELQFGFHGAFKTDDDAGLYALLGLYQYVINTGDLQLFQDVEPAVRRLINLWRGRIGPNGLVQSTRTEGKYYDIVSYGNSFCATFINSLLYQSLKDVADLEHALAEHAKALHDEQGVTAAQAVVGEYTRIATDLREAINRVLWTQNSPHGPMYADWIDKDSGQRAYYFTAAAQYMPIVFGIATPEHAHALLATAGARIAQLGSAYGYTRGGALSTLWPLPHTAIDYNLWPFGVYMNGGMLLQDTYYEVVARAESGDSSGAVQLLTSFARKYEETSWWGDNAATITGAMKGGSGEPYLSDMVIVPGSLVQGLMGLHETWDEMALSPHLPPEWHSASATLMHRGVMYCVTIQDTMWTRRPGRCLQTMERQLINARSQPHGASAR